ncbi:hypothetical protein IFR05_005576 [Cadophora sp. M221]|nr:hypothetical protein IFR05_005576 [Cadophora sp. M221]
MLTVPSVNPQCDKALCGQDYLMGEWCPRCRWTGFMVPYSYEEFAEGVPCGGYTGKVTRTVELNPEEFKHPKTGEQLWEGRVTYMDRMADFRKDQQRHRYDKLRELEEQREIEEQLDRRVSDLTRLYFMEENTTNDPEWNPCQALFYPIDQDDIPEDKELCGICHRELKTVDEDARCDSGLQTVALPCDHYFGLYCIAQWLADPKTPTCPECRHRYNIMYDLPEEGLGPVWPPGFEEQRFVAFHLESNLRWLYWRLVLIYFAKMSFIAVLFAHFPWTSWTNIWVFTFGTVLFYCSFIQFVQLDPIFSPRERRVQNRFALFSAVGNTIEILFAKATGVPGPSLWIYGGLSWVLLALTIYKYKTKFGLPV